MHYLASITMAVMIQCWADRNIDEPYMLKKTAKKKAPFETIRQNYQNLDNEFKDRRIYS